MKDIKNTPIWVKVLYANVHHRKVAWIIVLTCFIFSLYCIPWSAFSTNSLVAKLFLFQEWNWFLTMLPMTIWYWAAFKWVEKHNAW